MHDPLRKSRLLERARELGCVAAGVTRAAPVADYGRFRDWLTAGNGADMAHLVRHAELRADPRRILPAARSVVCVAVPYGPPRERSESSPGLLSQLFGGRDYHRVVKEILGELATTLDDADREDTWRAAVDTAPLLERSLAVAAGLGAIGRNTQLIVPGHGSMVVLGVLLTEHELEPDAEDDSDPCSDCRACTEACPTGALLPGGQLDARKCLSYWTTATRAPIPWELRQRLGNRLYGCDRCQLVCPHNQQSPAHATPHPALLGETQRSLDELHGLLGASRRALERAHAGTALDWLSRTTLLRTVCVLLGNRGEEASVTPLAAALVDRDPVIRAHAAWALGRIHAAQASSTLQAALRAEEDDDVRHEIDLALEESPIG